MSKADVIFKDMCEDILNNGTNDINLSVRPKWDDTGESAHTYKKFGVTNMYNLQEEFPAITFRKTAIISATDELLWIFQKKSNDVKELRTNIWNSWADENGSIGNAYGYQIRNRTIKTLDGNKDQMDYVLYTLRHDPFSRRIMTTLWCPDELHLMRLQPCVWSCNFNAVDVGADKPVLNLLINQRSNDVLVANNWNTVQYAVFLMMVSQVSNMIPGNLLHVIADAHIYDRHVDIVKELITREQHPAPLVELDPDIKDFYDFTPESVKVSDYICGPQVKNIPVAV